mgnify:FL=1
MDIVRAPRCRYLNLRSRTGLLFDRCDYLTFLTKVGKLREEAKASKEDRLRCTEYAQYAACPSLSWSAR